MVELNNTEYMTSRMLVCLCSLMCLSLSISGCIGNPERSDAEGESLEGNDGSSDKIPISIAYILGQNSFQPVDEPAKLAEILSEDTIFDVTVYPVESEEAMIESLRFGHVDLAIMDAASSWMSWKGYGLQTLMADEGNYGRTYYNSNAWVRSDSQIAEYHSDNDPLTDPFSLFEGMRACHTGWFDSVGMLLPMGFLLGLGYAYVAGNPNDIESLLFTIQEYFDESLVIPEAGSKYYGYSGALRCLSDGTGDIAFVQDTTPDEFCSEGEKATNSWCLPLDRYTMLPSFGKSPSKTLMYNPEYLQSDLGQKISDELEKLSDLDDMKDLLSSLFGTPGLAPVTSEDHLGGYSTLVNNIPGLQAYFGDSGDERIADLNIDEIIIGVNGPISNSTEKSFGFLTQTIENDLGVNVSFEVHNDQNSLIENLSTGFIHMAVMDGVASWKAWKYDNMSLLLSLLNENEVAFSEVMAVVNSEFAGTNSTDPFTSIKSSNPCLSDIMRPSQVLAVGSIISEDDGESLPYLENISWLDLVNSVFDEAIIPTDKGFGYNETGGEIRCLLEGEGQVAFIPSHRSSFCQEDSDYQESGLCLDKENYTQLATMGRLPHRSVMYNPVLLDVVTRTAFLNSMISLNYDMYLENFTTLGREYTGCYDISIHKIDEESPRDACGSEILYHALHSTSVSRASSHRHLGQLSSSLGHIPESVLSEYCQN